MREDICISKTYTLTVLAINANNSLSNILLNYVFIYQLLVKKYDLYSSQCDLINNCYLAKLSLMNDVPPVSKYINKYS